MLHYYSFEYGVVSKSDAFHVYCSRDRMVGLVVRTLKRDGAWADGHSRFFVWDDGLGSVEFETEREARMTSVPFPKFESFDPAPTEFRKRSEH